MSEYAEQAFVNGYSAGYEAGRRSAGERKTGRWRLETDEEEPNAFFKLVVCTACEKTANNTYNYCPNCGADMRGTEDGTTKD